MAEIMYHCRQKQKPVDQGISYHFFWISAINSEKPSTKTISRSPIRGTPFLTLGVNSQRKLPTVTRCLSKMDCREKFPQLVRRGLSGIFLLQTDRYGS